MTDFTLSHSENAVRLIALLDYIEQVEKLNRKATYTVPADMFAAFQADVKGLPGIEFNIQPEGEDVWMRVPRLNEIAPPEADEKLRPWVSVFKSPEKRPELKLEITLLDGDAQPEQSKLEDHPNVSLSFDWYVKEMWEPWASAERPRRKTMSFYSKLFAVQQMLVTEDADAPLELVWGMGCASWKKAGAKAYIRHPLVTQACEIHLDERTFNIDVSPRESEPRLELDCYAELELPGVRHLEDFWKSASAATAIRANPFESSSFEGVLKAAVGHLDATGTYLADQPEPVVPPAGDKLCITDTWVVFARKRSSHVFLQDVQRLKKRLSDKPEVPAALASFVQRGEATIPETPSVTFRGLSSSRSGEGIKELYFPLPYNDEQVSLIEKLETHDGVVVQGPPGTGKTHTIANVICHYLAQGKRVLVTAKGESALAVLQEKLPEQIRPLSVALLSDERDGMKQFEHAIQTIAAKVGEFNPGQSTRQIASLEARVNELHSKIVKVDQEITAYANKHMSRYSFQGREASPEELAQYVIENAERYEWLDDALPQGTGPRFSDVDVCALRKARLKVGADITYLGCDLPASDSFPSWPEVLTLHKDLVRAKDIEQRVTEGNVLALIDSTRATFERAKELSEHLSQREALVKAITAARLDWTVALGERIAKAKADDLAALTLYAICDDIEALEQTRRELFRAAVSISAEAELNDEVEAALVRLVAGKSAFALPFRKREARAIIGSVTISGLRPAKPEDWVRVARHIELLRDARRLVARWNTVAEEFGLPTIEGEPEKSLKRLSQWRAHIQNVKRLAQGFDAGLGAHIAAVFGHRASRELNQRGVQFLEIISESLAQQIDKGRLGYVMNQVSDMLKKTEGKSGAVSNRLRTILNNQLGSPSTVEAELQVQWYEAMAELKRLANLQSALNDIDQITGAVSESGAIHWAARLRTQPMLGDTDPLTPPHWLEAWNWRLARTFLERIDGHKRLKGLFDERRMLESDLARMYRELVAERTWLGVHKNSPSNVRQALAAYLKAVQSMGRGTGKRAIRYRRNARTAMLDAYKAVPCWVLPHYRVSETIPAEIGLFDLVVIDEASQSDIWALPALMRGKKLLVVGDHKQVSPSAVGTAEQKIVELVERFLGDQPHGAQMTPDKSIYDLACVVFAGNSVMLKEHFRCVPAIIEFSNREFYNGDIKPLRLPKAHERLDPPLIDVVVKGGYRKSDTNPPEARAVVDEIKAILDGSDLEGRSIGVVTLLGTEQATYIAKLVNQEISPSDILQRKISVGPPTVFQGRERDIMIISMVLAPGDRAAASRLEIEQRFNVALSRARDRMYLFRSVDESAFDEKSLTAKVIRHFREPFTQDTHHVAALRERCESGFEREMFDLLTGRNYRVEPQVKCGGYRIDFVVEGTEGRRLAVECDGDRFHGPGQWMDDMARQRVLERAGWTFWRCFASSFVLRRAEVVDDLLATLEKMGIEPLGSESVDNTVWTLHKEVDPYARESEGEEDENGESQEAADNGGEDKREQQEVGQ